MDALMRDLLPVIEFAAKAARTALAHVGAAIDCGMPAASAQRAHAAAVAFDPIDSAVPLPAETVPAGVSAGVQTTAPPAGLPFTFDVRELVATARELIHDHYLRNVWLSSDNRQVAHNAAEVVVSQLVADLTAAYTDQAATHRAAADARIRRALADAGFMETGQDMGASMFASEFFPQHTRKSEK